jgi:hypothetical protein
MVVVFSKCVVIKLFSRLYWTDTCLCISFKWLNELALTVGKAHCKRSSTKQTTKVKAMDLAKLTWPN